MARVVMFGIDPDLVDFTGPHVPPGLNADVIRRGIAQGLEDLKAAGHDVSHTYIPVDARDGAAAVTEQLRREPADVAIIGGGVRIPPANLALFQAVLNAIAQAEPTPTIVLVNRPDESGAAVAEVLSR